MRNTELNSQEEDGLHQNGKLNPNRKRSPEKEWDESYGQRFNHPYQMQQSDNVDAEKQQDDNTQNPEVSESDSNQTENQRNQDPTKSGQDHEVKE